jgi:hypothetical protein
MMTATSQVTSRYHVDERNCIIYVDSGWDAFARENGASTLQRDAVVGRPLLSFITGRAMKHLSESILQRVRSTRHPLTFPFRCDGPAIRRLMTLTMTPLEDDVIKFDVHTLQGTQRDYVALLDPVVLRSDEWLTVCSWCKRVDVQNEWIEVEDATARLRLLDAPTVPHMTHGICPDCGIALTREMARPA